VRTEIAVILPGRQERAEKKEGAAPCLAGAPPLAEDQPLWELSPAAVSVAAPLGIGAMAGDQPMVMTRVSPLLTPAVEADDVVGQRVLGEVINTPTTKSTIPVAALFQPMLVVTEGQAESAFPPELTQAEMVVAGAGDNAARSEESLAVAPADADQMWAGPAATASSQGVVSGPDRESGHQDRLREWKEQGGSRQQPERRESAWQLPQRRLEQLIRSQAASLAEQWRAIQVPLTETAKVLQVPERTLRQWRHDGCIPKKWSCCSHLKFLHVLQLRCWRANLQLRFQLC
jgi:hypothetical protein